MTTIAWDGQTLAADQAAWSGGCMHKVRKVHKITAPDGRRFLVALAGDGHFAAALLEWMRGGPHPGAYPHTQDERGVIVALVIDERHRVWRMGSRMLNYERVLDRTTATGAGQDFAIGALEAGASAQQAVRIAIRRSDYAGLGVDTVRFDPLRTQMGRHRSDVQRPLALRRADHES